MSEVFNLEKLYLAYLDCRKGKRKTINALKFEWDLERNLFLLLNELKIRKYKPGRSICFVVKEPTPREIFAANFRDRIVHHLLVREIENVGEKTFIFNAFSCRKGKGTHKAIKRLRESIRTLSKNYTKEIYYVQLDISGFFMSIDHNILYRLIEKLISKKKKSLQWEKEILRLAETIIFCKPTDNYIIKGDPSLFSLIPSRKSLFHSGERKGLPIGNHSSQFSANLYLNELDQFVKRQLKCKHYFRYVDDLILLEDNKERLKIFRDKIGEFLIKKLKIELNHKKTKIQSAGKGIDFLGYFVKPNYVLARKRVVGRFMFKLRKLNEQPIHLEESSAELLAMVNSYFGHFRHANSFNLRKSIYERKLGKLKEEFVPKPRYVSLTLKSCYTNLNNAII
jgi:RNA-directed DNA polymerase